MDALSLTHYFALNRSCLEQNNVSIPLQDLVRIGCTVERVYMLSPFQKIGILFVITIYLMVLNLAINCPAKEINNVFYGS